MPTLRQSRVISQRPLSAVLGVPQKKVQALSPTQPFTTAPVSMDTMSPSCRTRAAVGMPWTTSSLMEQQMEAGNPP